MSTSLHPVRTAKASTGAIAHKLSIGSHVLLGDAPLAPGGDDLGPDPHALLDAALASCTALTLMLYARRKGWPPQGSRRRSATMKPTASIARAATSA